MSDNEEVLEPEEIPSEKSLAVVNPMQLLELAVSKDLDVDKLEKLMQLERDWKAEQARIAYNEAMMEFQSKCPIIIKSVEGAPTKDGNLAYKFAPIDVILTTKAENGRTVKQLIADCGFSYMIKTEFPNEGQVKAICIVKHKLGHVEESSIEVPYLTKTGIMSDAQVVAGTSTFAMRYAFRNAFGIITGDEDNDGQDRQALMNQLNEIVKDWQCKDYVIKLTSQIKSSYTFRSFLSKMPPEDKVKEILTMINKGTPEEQTKWWELFGIAVIQMKWEIFYNKLRDLVKDKK